MSNGTRQRPCTMPGCPNLATRRGRCDQHPQRPSRSNTTRDYHEQQRRARAVQAWIRQHGHWCPGWNTPPHQSTDLVADHIDPVGAGGHPHGDLTILCRSCNATKGLGREPPTHPRGFVVSKSWIPAVRFSGHDAGVRG